MAVTTANKVADFFLDLYHRHGDLLTNLKLQKLLYYAQGWHLALYEKPLFGEKIQAWVHGPVVYSVYSRFKQFGSNPISYQPTQTDLPHKVPEFLTEIMNVFGKYHAFQLQRMTHSEPPWIKARGDTAIDESSFATIKQKDMQDYFASLADED